jgi:S1-C subfamily serine protease
VPFVVKNVGHDMDAAMEMIRRSGQQGVPVIATEDEVIVGFDQVRLNRLAERYGGPKRPPLGILAADAAQYLERHPEAAASLPPGTTGVYVGRVRADTVAERAGIRAGDVVTGFAGKRVKSMASLDQMVDAVKAGEEVSIGFLRDGEYQNTKLRF